MLSGKKELSWTRLLWLFIMCTTSTYLTDQVLWAGLQIFI